MADMDRVYRLRGRAGMEARARILQRDHHICQRCHKRQATEVDHIIPLFKGGEDIDSNKESLCSMCHRFKTNRDMGYRRSSACDSNGYPSDPDHPWNVESK